MTAALQIIPSTADLDTELSRFFQVASTLPDAAGLAKMPACIVDERWHQMMTDGTLTAFVTQTLGDGVTVEHIESGGVDPLNWATAYETEFGPLSRVWFTSVDGTVDEDAYARYLAGEQPEMSWDCTPKVTRDLVTA